MIKSFILLLCVSTLTLSLHAQHAGQQLDGLVQAYVKRGEFRGTVLVAKQGKILLEQGYGPGNTPSSIYQIASVTKTFTATLVLKLAELQLLSLQDKLSQYYPAYPKGDSITIMHLLTHTSGIYNYTRNAYFMEASRRVTEQEMLAWLQKQPLDFTPGAKYEYSNSGYALLGYIIQQATGMSYQQAMRKYIFEPLQMHHSGFDFLHLMAKEKLTGYYADSFQVYSRPAPVADSSVPFAAGSIYSTVEDLYQWHKGLQHYTVVSASSLEQAYTPFLEHYGYGWITDSLYGRRIVSHSGGMWGFRSNFARVPADDICIILLSNTETPVLENMTRKMLAILYDQPYQLPTVKKPVKLSNTVLKKYAGSYKLEQKELIVHISLEDGQLIARPENGPVSILVPEDETHFFLRDEEDFEIAFVSDESGHVTGLTIHNNDRSGFAKRLP